VSHLIFCLINNPQCTKFLLADNKLKEYVPYYLSETAFSSRNLLRLIVVSAGLTSARCASDACKCKIIYCYIKQACYRPWFTW